MKNKKMIFVIMVSCIFILVGMFAVSNPRRSKGNIDNVERIIVSENEHKREDIESAFDMIEKKFNTKEYKGCELNKIIYVGDSQTEENYKEKYEDALYLKVEFTTDKKPAVGLVANEDYEYKAVFVKHKGNWILKVYGQG